MFIMKQWHPHMQIIIKRKTNFQWNDCFSGSICRIKGKKWNRVFFSLYLLYLKQLLLIFSMCKWSIQVIYHNDRKRILWATDSNRFIHHILLNIKAFQPQARWGRLTVYTNKSCKYQQGSEAELPIQQGGAVAPPAIGWTGSPTSLLSVAIWEMFESSYLGAKDAWRALCRDSHPNTSC
jgi:hypothetical protein